GTSCRSKIKREPMLKYGTVIAIFTLLLISACEKQSAPELTSDYQQVRAESCSNVKFLNGLLERTNVVALFQCTQWDRQFPLIYKMIQDVSSSSWDHITEPIDKAFFQNRATRDRIFMHLKRLDEKGALDDLSYVATALNDTNFFS